MMHYKTPLRGFSSRRALAEPDAWAPFPEKKTEDMETK